MKITLVIYVVIRPSSLLALPSSTSTSAIAEKAKDSGPTSGITIMKDFVSSSVSTGVCVSTGVLSTDSISVLVDDDTVMTSTSTTGANSTANAMANFAANSAAANIVGTASTLPLPVPSDAVPGVSDIACDVAGAGVAAAVRVVPAVLGVSAAAAAVPDGVPASAVAAVGVSAVTSSQSQKTQSKGHHNVLKASANSRVLPGAGRELVGGIRLLFFEAPRSDFKIESSLTLIKSESGGEERGSGGASSDKDSSTVPPPPAPPPPLIPNKLFESTVVFKATVGQSILKVKVEPQELYSLCPVPYPSPPPSSIPHPSPPPSSIPPPPSPLSSTASVAIGRLILANISTVFPL